MPSASRLFSATPPNAAGPTQRVTKAGLNTSRPQAAAPAISRCSRSIRPITARTRADCRWPFNCARPTWPLSGSTHASCVHNVPSFAVQA